MTARPTMNRDAGALRGHDGRMPLDRVRYRCCNAGLSTTPSLHPGRGAALMTSILGLYRSANTVIGTHREDAILKVATRADAVLGKGDMAAR